MPVLPSYASGTSAVPLLGDTIGGNLDRAVAAAPGSPALIDASSGRQWSYAELAEDVDAVAAALLDLGVTKGDRVGIWAPNRPEWITVQYATARVGAILVTINPAYRLHELEYVLRQAGVRTLVAAREFKTSDYAGMIDQVRGNCPALRDVHLGHHRLPQGCHAVPPQHPEQRVLHRRAVRVHRRRPDLRAGAVLPLLRHGDGQPGGCQPRRVRGDPGTRLRPGGHPGRCRRVPVHLPVRGAHHVHRRAEPAILRRLRPVQPAHRHHGRLSVPGGGHEAGDQPDGHG